jgi:hypothetical protein
MSLLADVCSHRFFKRCISLIGLMLTLLLSRNVLAEPPLYDQYSESVCLLIAEQVDRFKQQPQLSSYQDAVKNYRRHCQKPVAFVPNPLIKDNKTTVNTVVPAHQPQVMHSPTRETNHVLPPQPVFDHGWAKLIWIFSAALVILLLRLLLRGSWGLNRNELLGQLAERKLAKLLERQLSAEYKHYRNLVLKTNRGDLTEIDHLVVSPFGIFVIEVKNYEGWIFGAEYESHWVLQHFRRKHQFQNPLRQNYKHTEAVAYLLEIDSNTDTDIIYSVVAFSRRAQFKNPMPENVLYIEDVHRHIRKISALGRKISDEALIRYLARCNLVATNAPDLRKEHKLQQQGQQLLREINQRRD